MQLHFYASIETINGIQQGHEMFVLTKEAKDDGMVHISVELDKYSVEKVVDSKYVYKVKRRKRK